jgi:excinuclease UvrABC helicase subunit UvrB
VARDTGRNLRVLDLCNRFAREESDRFVMEQYRPYILMMNARSRAQLYLQDNRPRAARKAVAESLGKLRQFLARFGQEDAYGASSEVAVLESLLKEIEAKIPVDPVQQLKRQLTKALQEERYEEAARLRDAIAQAAGHEEAQP